MQLMLFTASIDNAKLAKSDREGKYLTCGLSLSPHRISGVGNVCCSSTPQCRAACLNTAGHGFRDIVQEARIRKTRMFFTDREYFLKLLMRDLQTVQRSAQESRKIPAIRLNVFSDIVWEKVHPDIFRTYPDVKFYDYTKHFPRMLRFCADELPQNYHLTFSRSESNWEQCLEILKSGGNVSVVFRKLLPRSYEGFRVIDGDQNDLRFLHPPSVIIGLRSKGKARQQESGFVVDLT